MLVSKAAQSFQYVQILLDEDNWRKTARRNLSRSFGLLILFLLLRLLLVSNYLLLSISPNKILIMRLRLLCDRARSRLNVEIVPGALSTQFLRHDSLTLVEALLEIGATHTFRDLTHLGDQSRIRLLLRLRRITYCYKKERERELVTRFYEWSIQARAPY